MAIQITGKLVSGYEKILTPEALAFLEKLHHKYNPTRLSLLEKRATRQRQIDKGVYPDFLAETAAIRQDSSWKVAEAPADLQKRHVEITGPTEKKMMINALNSGADVFMADFEDALSPTWANVIEGQKNLTDAIEQKLSFTSPEGKKYALNEKTAVLVVRPRGWHLEEKHVLVDGEAISASIFDFGLYFFHNVHCLLEKKSGPYFYLPKMESHLEARLWNEIFVTAQDECSVSQGTIRATVLIETIMAAFEMEEILYELKEHASGLNAGRWDYIFSIIKKFQKKPDFILPDRAEITMTVPFMRAYTDLLIKTCHKRGAHAMGGMAAFIPSRKDPEVNRISMQKVSDDKIRESKDGFDGTWVAHPDLVGLARDVFASFLQNRPHQKERLRQEVYVTSKELLDFRVPGGVITEKGVRQNISVSLQYLESWLQGHGAVALFNLMEDAATCEISRAQLWQWIHHEGAKLSDGRLIDITLFRAFMKDEQERAGELARKIIDTLVTDNDFADFLTLLGYKYLN
jgi:malate synthase